MDKPRQGGSGPGVSVSAGHSLLVKSPTEKMNVVQTVLDRHVKSGQGQRRAIVDVDRGVTLTYMELYQQVTRMANGLCDLGIVPGDSVVLRLPFSAPAVVALLAVLRIGAVAAPTSVLLTASELRAVVRNVAPVAVIVAGEHASTVRALGAEELRTCGSIIVGDCDARESEVSFDQMVKEASVGHEAVLVDPESPFLILHTSGTTTTPKAVVRAHRMLPVVAQVNVDHLMLLGPESVCYQPHQDISFSYPLGHGLLFPLFAGASAIISPARVEGRFAADIAFDTIDRYQVSVFSAVPGVYQQMLTVEDAEDRFDLSSVRTCLSAAEALPATVEHAWYERFDLQIQQVLGQSEVPAFVGFFHGVAPRAGTLGKAFPGVEVAIVDGNGKRMANGEVGYLAISSSYRGLCTTYLNDSDKWDAVCHDGWYYTQDLAFQDEEGYFWYQSRADEVIKIRGYTVVPSEVEEALLADERVVDVAVVEDTDSGSTRLRAVIVVRPGEIESEALARDLRAQARTRLASYKVPDRLEFVDELPRAHTGKVARRELKGVRLPGRTY